MKGRYFNVGIGNVGKWTASMICFLFESRYALKGRYNIGNVQNCFYEYAYSLFKLRYALNGRYNIGNVGKTASMRMLTLFEGIESTTLVMLAKLLL